MPASGERGKERAVLGQPARAVQKDERPAFACLEHADPAAALRDLEAAALAEQDVTRGNADVLEQHLGVAVRRIVIAEHGKHLLDRDALGIQRHQDL